MKTIIITAFAFIMAVTFCACGPTPEEIAQTKWVMETIEEQKILEKQLDDTMSESEELLEGIDKEIEQILGMSLDEATGREENVTEEAVEPAAETVEADTEEPSADVPYWVVKIGDFEAVSNGLINGLLSNSVMAEDTEYEGHRIADVMEIANIDSFSEVCVLFEDGTSAVIYIADLFENDTLLIFKAGNEYLEQPILYFSDTLYEKAVIEIVIR